MTDEECVDAWLAANVEDERDARRVLDGVADAMRALLLETLGVLAALTGDALTTALHAELAVVAHDHASPPSKRRRRS